MEVVLAVVVIVCIILYELWSWLGEHGLRKFVVVLLLGWYFRSYIFRDIIPFLTAFLASTPGKLSIIGCLLLFFEVKYGVVSKLFKNLTGGFSQVVKGFTNSKYGFAMFIIVVLIYLQKEYGIFEALFNLIDASIAGHWEMLLGGLGAVILLKLSYKSIKGLFNKKQTQQSRREEAVTIYQPEQKISQRPKLGEECKWTCKHCNNVNFDIYAEKMVCQVCEALYTDENLETLSGQKLIPAADQGCYRGRATNDQGCYQR